jgi:putative membrane protein
MYREKRKLCLIRMSQTNKPALNPLTLTEQLAADRTRLANERTLLAYVRTALGLIVSGTGFAEYLDSPSLRVIFILFIPVGIFILLVGVRSFLRRRKVLNEYAEEHPPT